MSKYFYCGLLLLFSIIITAQQNTSSPYSFYGLGDVKFKGAFENRMMGGISVFRDTLKLNLTNPASYATLNFTTYAIGGTQNYNNIETESQQEKAQRTNLDYLAVAFPIGKKAGAAFGLMPFTAVGYSIQNLQPLEGQQSTEFKGSGGLNKVFAGFGYKILPNLTFGAEFQYNFGAINTNSIVVVNGLQFGTQELNDSRISGLNFNLGLQYFEKVSKKHHLFLGTTFAPQGFVSLNNERTINLITVNQLPIQSEEISVPKSRINLPSRYSIGIGFGEMKKWALATEVVFQEQSNFGNRFNDIDEVTFENATRVSIGGYYIPNYSSFSSYFKRVTYRAGIRFENTGMILNNKSIEDYAATLGLGLPIGNLVSTLNIGVEAGRRGTVFSGLVRENYINLVFALTLSDRWFEKRKYN